MRKAPLFIRLFSSFFIFMGVAALGALAMAWLNPDNSSNLSISFLTNKFTFTEHPILFTTTSLFFVFSGITGFTLLARKPWAYDLGIVYCLVGLFFFNALILLKIGLIHEPIPSLVMQTVIFGGFLAHLARNRTEWKTVNATIGMTDSGH